MPFCKYCHEEISKFDADLCPHCGKPHPIDPTYQTMDITRNFVKMEGSYKDLPKSKSLKTAVLLCCLLGYFGVHDFYLLKAKTAIIELCSTLLGVTIIGLILYFAVPGLSSGLAFLIPFAAFWIVYVLRGIAMLKLENPKDGRGEFLR